MKDYAEKDLYPEKILSDLLDAHRYLRRFVEKSVQKSAMSGVRLKPDLVEAALSDMEAAIGWAWTLTREEPWGSPHEELSG